MDVAIIGAGLTGLTAAYSLSRNGHSVTIFEKESFVGGLAHGFLPAPARNATHSDAGGTLEWDWPLEAFYHHIFSNDRAIIDLIREIGCKKELFFSNPTTATLIPNDTKLYPLDSPMSLLNFSPLSFSARIQTGMMLAFLKINIFWQPMESVTAETFIKTIGGTAGWNMLWEPLLYGKFGLYADKVSASWFWARIKKRTPSLGYFRGGFQTIANELAGAIKKQGGIIKTGVAISPIEKTNGTSKFTVGSSDFDAVLLTVPSPVAIKLYPDFPKSTIENLKSIKHLWAQMLILETKQPILNNVYWLNINDRSFPFLSMVAHTNFMDKKQYGGNHITYLGNYLPDNHPYLSMDKDALLKLFMPYVDKIKNLKSKIKIQNSYLFTAPNAQPVHTLHYSRQAPTIQTPIDGMYLANMDSIYPWDRGTNYAVELGLKAAEVISKR